MSLQRCPPPLEALLLESYFMIERYAERHQEARERVKDLGRVFRITVAAGPVKWLASDRGCPISANLAQLREDLCLILTAGEHYDGNREAPYKMPVRYITGFIKGQLQRNPNDAFVGETLDYMLSTIVNGSVLYDLISYPNVQRAISDMHNPESDEMRQNAINATEAFIGMGLVWDGLSQPGIGYQLQCKIP